METRHYLCNYKHHYLHEKKTIPSALSTRGVASSQFAHSGCAVRVPPGGVLVKSYFSGSAASWQ